MNNKPEPAGALLARAVHLANSGLVVLDAARHIVLWNSWMTPRAGLAAARVQGRPLCEVFPELRGSRVEAAVLAALTRNIGATIPASQEPAPFPLRAAGSFDGARLEQSVTVTPFDEGGERYCLLEIRDISGTLDRERRLLDHAESLRARSYVDGLTGIANRRHFDVALDRELRRTQRNGGALALLLMDIDSFKAYNDHFGHQEGDACLVKVAQEIAGILKRPADMAARYGGEEFAAILPDTSPEHARAMAERIRAHIEGLKLPQAPVAHHDYVTLSVGVAAFDRARQNDEAALIEAADQALYAAKDGGRNRVVADGDAAPAASRV